MQGVLHTLVLSHIINDFKYTSYVFYKNSGCIVSQVIPNNMSWIIFSKCSKPLISPCPSHRPHSLINHPIYSDFSGCFAPPMTLPTPPLGSK